MTDGRGSSTAAGLGEAVRRERCAAGLTQQGLADLVDASRQWVIRLEQGSGSVRLETVLEALETLGLEMVVVCDLPPAQPGSDGA